MPNDGLAIFGDRAHVEGDTAGSREHSQEYIQRCCLSPPFCTSTFKIFDPYRRRHSTPSPISNPKSNPDSSSPPSFSSEDDSLTRKRPHPRTALMAQIHSRPFRIHTSASILKSRVYMYKHICINTYWDNGHVFLDTYHALVTY